LNKRDVTTWTCSNFEFLIESNKNKQKTKAIAICRLMNEDDFEMFVDDQEELYVEKEDLEELHAKNEKKHANQNANHDELVC